MGIWLKSRSLSFGDMCIDEDQRCFIGNVHQDCGQEGSLMVNADESSRKREGAAGKPFGKSF